MGGMLTESSYSLLITLITRFISTVSDTRLSKRHVGDDDDPIS